MKYAQSIKTAILFSAFLILGLAFTPAHAAEQVVTLTTDNDVAGDGEEGDLRYAIANVGDGESITFNISGSDTVTLKAELNISDSGTNPLGAKNITINGINQYTGNAVTVQVENPRRRRFCFSCLQDQRFGKNREHFQHDRSRVEILRQTEMWRQDTGAVFMRQQVRSFLTVFKWMVPEHTMAGA